MIIAIDEVGDFNPKSEKYNYFIAVHINQYNDNLKRKEAQFEEWKSKINKDRFSKNNEIKGKDLSAKDLLDFAKNVISSDPAIVITQVRLIPIKNPEERVMDYKRIEIESYLKLIDYYKSKNKINLAKEYEKLVFWFKNRNYEQYLKIRLLSECICQSLSKSIGCCIMYNHFFNDLDNIMNIKYKIDKDFINGYWPRIFYYDFIRSLLKDFTKEFPIILPEEWRNNNHPFIKKYQNKDGKLDLADIFKRNNTQFLDSHSNFEIQIADITGAIIHKYQNRNTCKEAYFALVESFNKKEHFIIDFALNDEYDKEPSFYIE